MVGEILFGDCLALMREMGDSSVDSIVTDPPYGLAFMGKKWDYDVPSVEIWKEVVRVLKPGGHLLSFGGTRTYHRMVVNIEDAGFEIRDQVQWLYGSGFPKSLDISKAIDKAAGAEREVVGVREEFAARANKERIAVSWADSSVADGSFSNPQTVGQITAPSTDAAKQWAGWGTALKPANEPIVLARKPLEKGLTVAENVQKWGTGGINVDGGRIGGTPTSPGRFPANLILSEEAAEELDAQTQHVLPPWGGNSRNHSGQDDGKICAKGIGNNSENERFKDGVGASRFFYVAKASKRERNAGLEGMPVTPAHEMVEREEGSAGMNSPRAGAGRTSGSANHHPTVKPITLMRYLCRLITPPCGVVLDPFAGSGSTGVAALKEGFRFIGIEREAEYAEIARRRLAYAAGSGPQG